MVCNLPHCNKKISPACSTEPKVCPWWFWAGGHRQVSWQQMQLQAIVHAEVIRDLAGKLTQGYNLLFSEYIPWHGLIFLSCASFSQKLSELGGRGRGWQLNKMSRWIMLQLIKDILHSFPSLPYLKVTPSTGLECAGPLTPGQSLRQHYSSTLSHMFKPNKLAQA